MGVFNEKIIDVSDNITYHFISVAKYSDDFKKLIDDEIVQIRNGPLNSDVLATVKKTIKIWFNKKKDDRLKIGYISEFMCHLYLKQKGFEQYFLFKNLEENGPKKGFDGLYMKDNQMWLMESKSTKNPQKKHQDKIDEAFKDLSKKIKSTNNLENNPWENAKNHFENRNIPENESLSKTVKQYSEDFIEEIEKSIDEFHVIPCSTIFLGERYQEIDELVLTKDLKGDFSTTQCKGLNILCLNKNSINDFINLLDHNA